MELETLRQFFGWCSLINIAFLIYWGAMLLVAKNWIYRMSCRWLEVSERYFERAHFVLFGAMKILVLAFNVVPFFALSILAGG